MTHQERQEIKNRINADIKNLEQEISGLESQLQPIEPCCSLGSELRDEMLVDQERFTTILNKATSRLKKLHYISTKIDEDNYGICLECDEAIDVRRLMIVPESLYCVGCSRVRIHKCTESDIKL